MVSRRIEGAQKKVEERNFETRKNLLEYDEVMDEQRKRVYGFRQQILDGANCKHTILEMIERQIHDHLTDFLAKDYGASAFAKVASGALGVDLDARDFRGLDFESAQTLARDEALRRTEGQVIDAIDENLPDEVDQDEWNWEALAKLANTRWNANLRDRDLKKVGRDGIVELLLEKARHAIAEADLSESARLMDEDYGLRTACAWVHYKFGIQLEPAEIKPLELPALEKLVLEKAQAAYDEKETEYPVMAALSHFTLRDASGQKRYDRDELMAWARERFDANLDLEDLRSKQRDEVRELLVEHSRQRQQQANVALQEVQDQVEKLFGDGAAAGQTVGMASGGNGKLTSLSDWLRQKLHCDLPPEKLADLDREELEKRLAAAVEDHYRPEIRRMERLLVLQILDTAWKDHLLAMDHLRSSVGLRGYAQVDPKVEYKREGMRIFEQMWTSVGERVTDLIFRMEQLDEGFVGSTWKESEAIHQDAQSAGEIAAQQQAAIEGTEVDHKPQPIRNRQQRVGRNDPCPCGSGKKFKQCCMRKG